MSKQTNIKVKLVGEDGNIFAIMGRVSRILRDAGFIGHAKQMCAEITKCGSYDEALTIVQNYVEVS